MQTNIPDISNLQQMESFRMGVKLLSLCLSASPSFRSWKKEQQLIQRAFAVMEKSLKSVYEAYL
jgi:L-ribulose-5-phosphate 3-epimerase UlaE